LAVVQNFAEGAEVAKEYEYWNASGVLIVHAAIAYADAISIKLDGVKSRGEAHQEAADLPDELAAASEEKKSALAHLRKIIEHKNIVSYSGEIYHRKDVEQLWKLLKRFQSWAENILK